MLRLPRIPFALAAASVVAAAVALAAPAKPAKPAASAAPAGDPAAQASTLLDQVATRYLGFTSYDIEGTSHMILAMAGQTQQVDVPFRLAAAKPARLRNELMNPMMPYVTMSDGAKTWVWLPASRQYTEKDAAPLSTAGANSGDIGSAMAMGTPIQRYLSARSGLVDARVTGTETIEAGGAQVPCTVVVAQYATPDSVRVKLSPNTFWIDPARGLVLRDSLQVQMPGPDGSPVTMATVTTFRRLDVDHTLPDTLFRFIPPADAKQVASFNMPGMQEQASPLVGKPASDFQLRDLSGTKRSLASLKGKVVLLDFWATWCGPCRRELPTIAKLHKELGPKGLAVVCVNVGEPLATVSAFLKKNGYTMPVWLDAASEVSQAYSASSIPTLVVIDKAGNVASYNVGVHEEADLRQWIAKAGLK